MSTSPTARRSTSSGPAADVVHLVCEVCGRDVPVPSDVFDPVREGIAARYDFELTAHHFAVVGRCTGCAGQEPEHTHSGVAPRGA